jgi:hypothetical protein
MNHYSSKCNFYKEKNVPTRSTVRRSDMLGRVCTVHLKSVSQLRQLVASYHGFVPRAVHVRFMVDKMALGQCFLRVLWFFHVGIIPSQLHIH